MKITLSKSQWEMIGTKTGWIKQAGQAGNFKNTRNIFNQIVGLYKKDTSPNDTAENKPSVIISKVPQSFVQDKNLEEVFSVKYNDINIGQIQTSDVLDLCELLKSVDIQYNTL